MNYCTVDWNIIWTAVSAISTLLAVLVALFLPIIQNRTKRKLEINTQITTFGYDGMIRIVVTVDNIGNRNISITGIGLECKDGINIDFNKFLENSDLNNSFIINNGETMIISYLYNHKMPFDESDETNIKILEAFKKRRFVLRDSLGNLYKG